MSQPEAALGRYDVVFAKARCALEALATGAAVVLCDAGGLGPMVTMANVERLRWMNFGQGVLTRPITVEGILAELRRYDADDAARVCARIRAVAGLEQSAREWVRLYGEAVEEARCGLPAESVERAAFEGLQPRFRREARLERQEGWWQVLGQIPLAGSPAASIARRLVSAFSG
jgi:hypothetical protein